MSYNTAIDLLESVETKIDELKKAIPNGEISYHFSRLKGYAKALFEDFCPFKEGDRVKLLCDVIITSDSHGWRGCGHFLTRNSLATVYSVDYNLNKKKFTMDVIFDIESWLDDISNKQAPPKERPVYSKHTFCFSVEHFKKVTEQEEKSIINKESKIRKALRLYFNIQEYLLNNKLINNDYDVCPYSTLKTAIDSYDALCDIIKQVNVNVDLNKLSNECLNLTLEDLCFKLYNIKGVKP